MSSDAFDDERDVPETWEDTAVRQELDAVYFKFVEWRRVHRNDMSAPELEALANNISDAISELQEAMSGKL